MRWRVDSREVMSTSGSFPGAVSHSDGCVRMPDGAQLNSLNLHSIRHCCFESHAQRCRDGRADDQTRGLEEAGIRQPWFPGEG